MTSRSMGSSSREKGKPFASWQHVKRFMMFGSTTVHWILIPVFNIRGPSFRESRCLRPHRLQTGGKYIFKSSQLSVPDPNGDQVGNLAGKSLDPEVFEIAVVL